MNGDTARVFVKDTIFDLTMTTLAPHLWDCVPLSDIGIGPESIQELALRLSLNPVTVKPTMKLEELVKKVAAESPLDVKIVTGGFFDLFFN